jgi:hypothetical protein
LIETPTDWYYRSRNELLKSVIDGIDIPYAVGDFHFAKMNLENHGVRIEETPMDEICDSLLKQVKKKRHRFDKKQKGVFSFERGSEMRLGEHPWQGRMTERSLFDLASSFPHAEFAQGQHYSESHPHHKDHHPLRQKHAITGRSKMIEKLRRFYLASKPGGMSLAQRYKEAEKGKENYEQKQNNLSVVGKTKFDNAVNKDVKHYNHLGPLKDNYAHDLYLRDFERWKGENPASVKEMMNKYPIPDEHEHALQLMHFEDASDRWEGDQYHSEMHDPKEGMTEQEIHDHLYSGKSDSELEPKALREALGYEGYLYGLEFLSPLERQKVINHVHGVGTDAHDAQDIDLGGGMRISAGRIKRNLAQRFTGEFDHYMRPQHMHGANVRKHYETIEDIPFGESRFINQSLIQAMQDIPFDSDNQSSTSVYDNLLSEYNELLTEHQDAFDVGTYEKPPEDENFINQLPISAMRQGAKIHEGAKAHPVHHGEGILQELKTLDEKEQNFVNVKTMLGLMGYNEDMTEMDSHPLLLGYEGALVSQPKIKQIMDRAKKLAEENREQKPIRNHDWFHHGGSNGYDITDIPVNEREHYLTDDNNNIIGLGAHFADEFHHQGGMGRNVLHYLEMIHDSSPKDAEGYSVIGKVDGNEFIPNPKTIGLWGRYVPSLYSKEIKEHIGGHGITSLWDSSNHIHRKPRNNKNMPFRQASSLNGEYANAIRYMSEKEREIYYNGSAWNVHKDGANHFGTNPINAIGGMGMQVTQSHTNSVRTHRNATMGGRLHPPHEPMKKNRRLSRKNLPAGSKLSHNEGSKELFRVHQGHKTKKTDAKRALTESQRTAIQELDDEYDNISEEIMNYEQGSDEYARANLRLHEIESQIDDINTLAQPDFVNAFEHLGNHSEKKDESDMNAILAMAQKMKPEYEKADSDAFNPEFPDKFIANTSRLFKDANLALMRLPHEAHGLETHGYGEVTREQKSASELLSQGDNVVSPHHTIASVLGAAGKEILPTHSPEKVRSLLNLPNDDAHNHMITRLLEGMNAPLKVLRHGDLLGSGVSFAGEEANDMFTTDDHHEAINSILREHVRTRPSAKEDPTGRVKADRKFSGVFHDKYGKSLTQLETLFRPNQENQLNLHGLSRVQLSERKKDYGKKMNAIGSLKGNMNQPINSAKSRVHDLYVFDPTNAQTMDKVVAPSTKVKEAQFDSFPIHPVTSGRGVSVQDMFASGTMDSGYAQLHPSVGAEFPGNKTIMVGTNTEPQFLHSIPEELMTAVHGQDAVQQVLSSGYQVPVASTNMNRPDITGLPPNIDPMAISTSDPSETLMVLMNPDALLKEDKARPPPILPMHRIFSLKDFEALRGFSGDWVVSAFYDGKRMIIIRKGSRFTAYDGDNNAVPINEEHKASLKKLTEKNYIIDAVQMKDNIHIIDLLDYDDTNVSDMTVRERLKVLRGQFDSHDKILVPGPFDTRITEDGGLESTVESLQQEHKQLLLRDGNSTYMRGERRHPKWFLLRKNKNVSFIILDVRGKGPYTYRLGAGPLDSEGFGNRGVDYEGKQYLDVGTIKSPKPFKEGETVSISVSGVKKRNRNGKTIYDVTSSKILGEADAESPASLETLSLLAKSHPVIPVPYDITLKNDKISIIFDGLDEVIYKSESSHTGNWAHSPQSVIGELGQSDYTLQLAESVKPLWKQAVSLMMKGVDKKEDSVVEEIIPDKTYHSMHSKKDRRHSEKQSAGVIDADDEMNIMKPGMKTMLKTITRIADLTERLDTLQKEKMTGGASRGGLGIDVGSAIESPRGPTSLTSEESVPDWDMIERPTEDSEEEYEHLRNKRLKRKKGKQYNDSDDEDEEE